MNQLDELLGQNWSHGNPVGLVYNASGQIYQQVIDILFKDKGVDAVMIMHVPFAGNNPLEVAKALVDPLRKCKRLVLLPGWVQNLRLKPGIFWIKLAFPLMKLQNMQCGHLLIWANTPEIRPCLWRLPTP